MRRGLCRLRRRSGATQGRRICPTAGGARWPAIPREYVDARLPESLRGESRYDGRLSNPRRTREAYATLAVIDQKHQLVGQDIDRALQLVTTSRFPTTGVAGDFLKTFYQPGRDLASLIETIGANVGLDELQSLKASGTTLGQVTEAEHRLLQSVMGNLKQSQSQDQFTQNLQRLKTTLADVKQRRQQAAQRQFGGGAVPAPRSPYSTLPVDQLTDEQAAEEERWLKQQLGQ